MPLCALPAMGCPGRNFPVACLPKTLAAWATISPLVLRSVTLYLLVGGVVRCLVPRLPQRLVYNRFNAWGRQRELPPLPAKSFRQLYRERHGQSR